MSACNQVLPLLVVLVPIVDDALNKSMMHLSSPSHVLLLSNSSVGIGATGMKLVCHVEAGEELAILLSKCLCRVQTITFYADDFERLGLLACVFFTFRLLSPASKVSQCLLINRVATLIEDINSLMKHLNTPHLLRIAEHVGRL